MADSWQPQLGARLWLGAPIDLKQRQGYLDKLTARLGDDRKVTESIIATSIRITDKSVGLLQAVSIFAAVALFLTEWQGGKETLPITAALIMMFVAALLLVSNLGVVWYTREQELSQRAYSIYVLNIATWRAVRFSIGLYLSFVGFGLVLLQYILGALQ